MPGRQRVRGLSRQGWAQLGSEPRAALCPGCPALPNTELCSSVSGRRQKVKLQPDGLCLVKNHTELSKWEVSLA